MFILPPSDGTARLPVKIFSGIDYIVEKTVNSFVKNIHVVDVRISSHSHKDSPHVSVLILYEGDETLPGHASGSGWGGEQTASMPRRSAEMTKRIARENVEATAYPVAVAVWVAAATLHHDAGGIGEFKAVEIYEKVVEQGICGVRKQNTISSNITQYCVANAKPGQGNHRKLYRVGHGRYRLYRPTDDCSPGREGGPAEPRQDEIPDKYKYLLDWYIDVYCKTHPQ